MKVTNLKDYWDMKFLLNTGLTIVMAVLLFSCSKDATSTIEEPFVHIMQNELSSITVSDNRRDLASYYIYFSSPDYSYDLEVDYSIEVGDGLEEGVDFEVITTENPRKFPSGITERPIQIRWMENSIDPEMDNTIRIIINDTSPDVTIGLPGSDNNQSEFIITIVSS